MAAYRDAKRIFLLALAAWGWAQRGEAGILYGVTLPEGGKPRAILYHPGAGGPPGDLGPFEQVMGIATATSGTHDLNSIGDADAVLQDFQERGLGDVPLLIWTFGVCGPDAAAIAAKAPDRVKGIFMINTYGFPDAVPMPDATLRIPMGEEYGSDDAGGNGWHTVQGSFLPWRAKGGEWYFAQSWGERHTSDAFCKARGLGATMDVFLYQVFTRRLAGMAEADGWLAYTDKWGTGPTTDIPIYDYQDVAPYKDFKGDKSKAPWFPNEYLARVWQAVDAHPTHYTCSKAQVGGVVVNQKYAPGTPVTLSLSGLISKATLATIDFYDGNIPIGRAKPPLNLLTGVKLPSGVHGLYAKASFTDGTVEYSELKTIIVDGNGPDTAWGAAPASLPAPAPGKGPVLSPEALRAGRVLLSNRDGGQVSVDVFDARGRKAYGYAGREPYLSLDLRPHVPAPGAYRIRVTVDGEPAASAAWTALP